MKYLLLIAHPNNYRHKSPLPLLQEHEPDGRKGAGAKSTGAGGLGKTDKNTVRDKTRTPQAPLKQPGDDLKSCAAVGNGPSAMMWRCLVFGKPHALLKSWCMLN